MSKPSIKPRYIKAGEAAHYCGMSENSFRASIAALIPRITHDNLTLVQYDTRDIDRLMESRKEHSGTRSGTLGVVKVV